MVSSVPHSAACILGQQITVRGTLTGEEDLLVEGRVEGSVSLAGHLIVAESGVVEADLDHVGLLGHGHQHVGEGHRFGQVTGGAQCLRQGESGQVVGVHLLVTPGKGEWNQNGR